MPQALIAKLNRDARNNLIRWNNFPFRIDAGSRLTLRFGRDEYSMQGEDVWSGW